MIVVGLTGGPGTGKSLAASYLERRGAVIISGDDTGRRAVEEYPAVLRKLVRTFGKKILRTDETLDRHKLGGMIFADPEARRKLDAIVHPRLLRILKRDLKKHRKNSKANLIIIDAALIFEWAIADWCNYILVVTAKKDIRLHRLMAQGLSRRQSEDRIRSQIPDRQKAALADYIIENNGSKTDLRSNIDSFLKSLGPAGRGSASRPEAGKKSDWPRNVRIGT
jgi:dephospho-CoA kinase